MAIGESYRQSSPFPPSGKIRDNYCSASKAANSERYVERDHEAGRSETGEEAVVECSMDIVAIIHEEDGAFGISFPDLPGCISAADRRDELLVNAREALAGHIESMTEHGEPLPALRSEAALRTDPEFDEWFADAAEVVLVRLPASAGAIDEKMHGA